MEYKVVVQYLVLLLPLAVVVAGLLIMVVPVLLELQVVRVVGVGLL
jgi:hypothetical protein